MRDVAAATTAWFAQHSDVAIGVPLVAALLAWVAISGGAP